MLPLKKRKRTRAKIGLARGRVFEHDGCCDDHERRLEWWRERFNRVIHVAINHVAFLLLAIEYDIAMRAASQWESPNDHKRLLVVRRATTFAGAYERTG